ncbi:MAG: glycosyltransferase [Chitinophagaceae bacterium]|nr:glycosyltransferase [Anaerolineae bacterium]
MSPIIGLLTLIYVIAAVFLAVFSSSIFIFLALWWWHRTEQTPLPQIEDSQLPSVTVQLPLYNESAVVERLLAAIASLDYPRSQLHIQVLDDSDDETKDIVARWVAYYANLGIDIQHIRRPERKGYKAGALAYGLMQTYDEIVAIFDADFVPKPDFLRNTVPYFMTNPDLGIVQCRWSHLNAEQNLITRSQSMSIDAHFIVEQTARNRGGLLIGFNGTGGLWRRTAIEDAGGWSHETVSEDLDLSYRAQMCGWKYLYLPHVEVPAELPPQVAAYKRQQARWAKGTTQNLMRLLGRVWRNKHLRIQQKLMGTLHLCQYMPQPLLLMMTLLTPILMVSGVLEKLPLPFLGFAGLAAPVMYLVSERSLYRDWPRRLLAFPFLIAIGSGVMFSNTVSVCEALLGRPAVFKRTPKISSKAWQDSQYALRPDWTIFVEGALVVYTAVGGIIALQMLPGLAPFLFAQTYGFGAIVVWSLFEWIQLRQPVPAFKSQAEAQVEQV